MKFLAVIALLGTAFFLGFFFNQTGICRASASGLETVSPAEFSRRLSACSNRLIDVRTAEEFASGHLADAANEDFYQTEQFNSYLESLPRENTYFIYCRTGHRSGQVLQMMRDKGFKSVVNLDGGITAWTAAGLPVTNNLN